ncbi:Arc family DNA-binding protein [Pseudomonas yamanorum]|uniref:Arc family DNA-binding protein n=1 Tax=Pseudomonas yamanorum TaxID=515393 RepID=A0ABU1CQ48_9PSED|nr:Arc family DNA-binding protein [Pseudomonas yamanorum]MDR0189393.1 Arc family DNA-binding protein [Pseudomonas yamanorum]
MPNNLERFVVRLPRKLHTSIKSLAKAELRSMNNVIVTRLERSLPESDAFISDIKLKKLLLDRIDFLEVQVDLLAAELIAISQATA